MKTLQTWASPEAGELSRGWKAFRISSEVEWKFTAG